LKTFASDNNISLEIPISDYPQEYFNLLFYGSQNSRDINNSFNGLIPHLRDVYNEAYSVIQQKELDTYRKTYVCNICNGKRLNKESLSVLISNHSIDDIVTLDIEQCLDFFINLSSNLDKNDKIIAELISKEICNRLQFLLDVGLPYFSLNRTIVSLSGGEAQRIRLASQIGSQLVGITYVLDEPSIGLHQHDNNKLIESLKKLRDIGNSVIIVEHDRTMIEKADFVVDIGPGAGTHGGEIIFASEIENMHNLSQSVKDISLTYQYITDKKSIPIPNVFRKPNPNFMIKLFGAKGNNLRNVNLEIPLGLFICVTGIFVVGILSGIYEWIGTLSFGM